MFTGLSFRYPFRKYQRMILEQVAGSTSDHRYHLVAPPGAGKTIVGLELIRRFGQPAVIFAPTTTIQAQWREKVAMFLPEGTSRRELDRWVSLDPQRLAPITILTYQVISTAGQSVAHVRDAALTRWLEDLMHSGQTAGPQEAAARLEALRQNNAKAYRQELSRRYLRVKRELLQSSGADVRPFLHPNALELIDALAAHGIGTVVLDECHHLLDYWAVVLHGLLGRLPDARVVGLTATLPSPEDDQEYENYNSLLGDVDFEVPTPAVVKEGDLAPYRDLVYFVEPSRREINYLRHIQSAFEEAIGGLTNSLVFRDWVEQTVLYRRDEKGKQRPWDWFVQRTPLLALAGVRFLRQVGVDLPDEEALLADSQEDGAAGMHLEDWAVLLERFGLDYLKVSPHAADHKLLDKLRSILLPFGLTLTERGMRQSRSPGDLVLAFSESKDRAVADILSAEERVMGERLRAVIVTDFERMSSGVRQLEGVLDQDAGSAIRLFESLARLPAMDPLCPVLATGRSLWIDSTYGERLLAHFNDYLRRQNLFATCRAQATAAPDVLEVVGEGKDWSSRVYVAMVTAAFDRGLTRCLIGTRGIFGEGWDSLAVNTLIDLTSVTTSTSVQQLRGRSIRLDPAWPRKVAHNWDVICVAPRFEKGDGDLRRFIQRHERYWGIVPLNPLEQLWQDSASVAQAALEGGGTNNLPAQMGGQIIRGVSHVNPNLSFELGVKGFTHTNFGQHTHTMLAEVNRRDLVYDWWGIGREYSNFVYTATRLDVSDLKIRTVFSITETLKAMLRQMLASFFGMLLVVVWLVTQVGLQMLGAGAPLEAGMLVAGGMLGLGFMLTLAVNLRSAYRLGRRMLVEQPPDTILLDVGHALLHALQQGRLVSRNLQADYVRVVEMPDNSYQVLLDYASPEDAALFVQAYQDIFSPVRDQRYLVLRNDAELPHIVLAPLWKALRGMFGEAGYHEPAYHPVPRVLSGRKELAEAFALAWQEHVGGGELVFTRSETGRKLLFKARAQRRPKVKGLAFEIWL